MISSFQQQQLLDGLEQRAPSREVRRHEPCIATVVAVDPQTGCVKLSYGSRGPSTTGQPVESDWAPVALPLSGPGSGVCFLPDPKDRVQALVVFLEGYRSKPVVVGYLPSKVDARPDEARAGDQAIVVQKDGPGIVLRAKTDEHDAAVLVRDGKGNSFEIRTEDNGIVITVAEKGSITLAAPGGTIAFDADIVQVTGRNKIEIQGGELAATATGTHVIKGKTVEINC